MSPVLFALFYVLGLCSAAILAYAVPDTITRVHYWLTNGDAR